MHHSYTHAKRNNNTNHRQHNSPSQTNHHPPTHKQQSTNGQKHRHTSNQHKRHQKQNRGTKKPSTQHPTGHHHNTRNKNSHRKLEHLKYPTTPPPPPYAQTESTNKEGAHHTDQGRHNFTNINIPKAINKYNTELQLIKIHIRKTKDSTVANTYIPPRDTTSPHYNTVDTDITYCKRHVTNIPDSILTGDVNAHSTLWYSHTDDHSGQRISDIISNSEHITLNNTPTRVPHTTLQQATSPDITTISTTLYNRTTWHTIHARIRIRMILFRKYKCKWCNKNELKYIM